MKTLAIARAAVAAHAARHSMTGYPAILTIQGLERIAFLFRQSEDLAHLERRLAPFLAGQVGWPCNFPNYLVGGNGAAAALFHGLVPAAKEAVTSAVPGLLDAPKGADGLVIMRDRLEKQWLWIDAAWAFTPFSVHAGLALGRPEVVEEGCKQVFGMIAQLRNADNGLLHQVRNSGTITPDHWGRGNGWAVLALAPLVEDLPTNHPRRAEAVQTFTGLLAACLKVQGPSGMWHQELPRHDSYAETSGTAMICYGLGVALALDLAPALGVSQAEVRAALERGLRALLGYLALDGSVHHTCIGCCHPGSGSVAEYMANPHAKDDNHAFGPFVLAFAQAAAVGITDLTTIAD
jgi:unsaturated rhamnogalacturonyl hydrolase